MESIKREDLLAKGWNEEQVTDYLNMVHSLNNENKKLQDELGKITTLETQNQELQKQLDDIAKANMTEQEKMAEKQKEIETNLENSKKIYNTAKAKEILAGLDVDDKIIETLVSADETKTIEMANLLKTKLDTDREKYIKETKESITNLDVKPTITNVPQTDDSMTVDKFNAMSMTEQVMWKKANEQEYNNLFNN